MQQKGEATEEEGVAFKNPLGSSMHESRMETAEYI